MISVVLFSRECPYYAYPCCLLEWAILDLPQWLVVSVPLVLRLVRQLVGFGCDLRSMGYLLIPGLEPGADHGYLGSCLVLAAIGLDSPWVILTRLRHCRYLGWSALISFSHAFSSGSRSILYSRDSGVRLRCGRPIHSWRTSEGSGI